MIASVRGNHIFLVWVFKHRGAKTLDHSESFMERTEHTLIIEVSRNQRKHQRF